MKKLLTLLLILPMSAFAQKFEIAAMGGVAYTSVTDARFSKTNSASGLGSLQAQIVFGSLSLGAKVDVFDYAPSYTSQSYNLKTGMPAPIDFRNKPFSPCITYSVLANKRISLLRTQIHFGVNAGMIFGNSKTVVKADKDVFSPLDEELLSYRGSSQAYSFGIQGGVTFFVTKRIGIIAEVAPRYIYVTKAFGSTSDADIFSAISIPVSAGLSFKL